MRVEWDSDKNTKNVKKHGIDFRTAAAVFLDQNRIELYDSIHSTVDEDRYIVIGMVEDVLFVVYTTRDEAIRMISARYANQSERRRYYDRKRRSE